MKQDDYDYTLKTNIGKRGAENELQNAYAPPGSSPECETFTLFKTEIYENTRHTQRTGDPGQ